MELLPSSHTMKHKEWRIERRLNNNNNNVFNNQFNVRKVKVQAIHLLRRQIQKYLKK